MRLEEILTEDELNELNIKKALATGAMAAGLALGGASVAKADTSAPPQVKTAMVDVMKADKMVSGYQMKGDTLVLKINNDRPVTDIKHYGYDDNYKKDVMKMTGAKKVEFQTTVDPNKRDITTQLSPKGKELYKQKPHLWGK
jgi:hypothetical protein